MIIRSILKLTQPKQSVSVPFVIMTHTATCPTRHQRSTSGCGGAEGASKALRRAGPGKVRMGFIPEEWFLFFHSKTGVTGPYLFGIVVANYLLSKEIYVMEHEYYSALSILPMMYFTATRLGPGLGKMLDKEVDDFVNTFEKRRQDEKSVFENIIKDSKQAQRRAEGQKVLMDAKKENIAMQLEAIYRERCMQLFRAVKGRMDYQVKMYRVSARIQQKWMIQWITQNVMKSLTPEFEKAYLDQAIGNIVDIASRTTR